MAIKWGNTEVIAVKWGNTNCTAVYWGSTKVFPDEIVLYNGSNATSLFYAININRFNTSRLDSILTSDGINKSGSVTGYTWKINTSTNNPMYSNAYRYAQYYLNSNNIQIYGKTINDDGDYNGGGTMLVTKSTYNMNNKTKISITCSGISTNNETFIGTLSSIPSSWTSSFKLDWVAYKYTGETTYTFTATSGTKYICICRVAAAYQNTGETRDGTDTITKIVIS